MTTNVKCLPKKLTKDLVFWDYFGDRSNTGPDTLPVMHADPLGVKPMFTTNCIVCVNSLDPSKNNSYSLFKPPSPHTRSSDGQHFFSTGSYHYFPNLLHVIDWGFGCWTRCTVCKAR